MKHAEILALLIATIGNLAAITKAAEPPAPTVGDLTIQKLLGPRAKTVALWPDKAPDEPRPIGDETVKPALRKEGVVIVTNVSQPSMTLVPPENATGPTPAVVVCPGGGYGGLGIESEGKGIIEWLNSCGATGVLLKYRVPKRHQGYEMHHHALEDAQRAVGMLRENAKAWNLDPRQIGVIGFSAGGHLAAALSNNYAERLYQPVDDADEQSCKPDFAVLIYPAYLTKPIDSDERDPTMHPEKMSRGGTPPTFIAVAQADKFSRGAICYFRDLSEARVPAELHIYDGGGHGNGLGAAPLNEFGVSCARWLKTRFEAAK